jgi:hypothetical protein
LTDTAFDQAGAGHRDRSAGGRGGEVLDGALVVERRLGRRCRFSPMTKDGRLAEFDR